MVSTFITDIMRDEMRNVLREVVREEVKAAVAGQTTRTWVEVVKSGCSTLLGGMSTLLTTSSGVLTSVCAPVVSDLSPREKVVLAGVGLYGLYRYAPRLKNFLPERTVKTVLNLALPQNSREYIHESVREGSMEMKFSVPRCQVPVGYFVDGVFKVHGNAVRLDEWLLVPDHVLQQEDCAHVKLANGKFFDLKTVTDTIAVETDVVAVRVSEAVMSQLGVQKVLLQHEHSDQGIGVAVVGAQGLGTTGALTPGSFGRVIYSGTTRGGYSGAAYMQGSRIVGIHLHGGKVNGGFSISYLWCNLKYELREVQEGSEDFLRGLYKASAKVEVDASWHDLDTKRFRTRGRYHIVGIEAWSKVYKEDPRPAVISYEDYPQEIESLGFHDRMVLNKSTSGPGEDTNDLLSLTSKLVSLSPKKRKLVKSFMDSYEAHNTAGQQGAPKKNMTASSSTPTAI